MSELTGFEMPNTEYDGPCTFVYGGASPYVRADHHQHIYRLFPNAELECLEGAGHWLHAEQPDAFSRAVVRHLKAHESGCSNNARTPLVWGAAALLMTLSAMANADSALPYELRSSDAQEASLPHVELLGTLDL